MTLQSRLLSESTSFAAVARSWATTVGLLDGTGNPTSIYPVIIGMPSGSETLGGFPIGIIQDNRTIKQALQDLEAAVDGRMFASNNLSDLPNKPQARTNLGLGTAATWPVGTSGSAIPLMNTINDWQGRQRFLGGVSSTGLLELTGTSGSDISLTILNGTSKRWAVYKDSTADTLASTGSDFKIARFNNNGDKIDDVLTISRATGVLSLIQPLPVASGGTGANSLAGLRTQLAINNVDNTADVNKPISTPQQTALNNKYDRAGGTVSGWLGTTGYIRSGGSIIVDGTADEGGQIILSYRSISGLSGQSNSTWNIDVGDANNFRVFRQNASGQIYTPIDVSETGGIRTNGTITASGDGSILTLIGTANQGHGLSVRTNSGSSSTSAYTYVDHKNENGIPFASSVYSVAADGSSSITFAATPSGSRTTDRRANVLVLGTSAITASVPINGRAYPRLESGNDLKMNWSGQTGQPGWVWGGNDGTNMYVYNPSNFSVANSNNLGNISGGNGGGYVRRTTDAAGNGQLSRQLVLMGSDATEDVWSSPLELREVGNVSATQTTPAYAPALLFHWGATAAAAIKLHSDGTLRFQSQSSSVSYASTWAHSAYVQDSFRVNGSGGLYFNAYNRGLSTAEAGGSYGHVNTVGSGLNGYAGYSINTWASFMSNGADTGIYSSSQGRWLLRFDTNGNATFSANVTAYSDERLKSNMRPIDNVAQRRAAMAKAAIIYDMDGQERIGFGAQTLESGVPEVVHTADDLTQIKSVNYSDTIAILAVDNDNLAKELAETKLQLAAVLERLEKAGL